MLEHGGDLRDAVLRFGRPREEWLDLSTVINPHPYPTPALDPHAWHELPASDSALAEAARHYYNAPSVLPVAGAQAAIQALPNLRSPCRVAIAAPAYAEHAHRWKRGGHAVRELPQADLADAVDESDVVVVCNPNNPTGSTIPRQTLLDWAERLGRRGGWLVVDEAVGDTVPHFSLAPWADLPGIVVLRSIGKFFGLAGMRLGFVAAQPTLLEQLTEELGPWAVSGPAIQAGCAALNDRLWQDGMRRQLLEEGTRLHVLLREHGIASSGTTLFQWWPEAQAEAFWQHMAQHGIWVRLFGKRTGGIRIGLPGNEAGWTALEKALAAWSAWGRK